MLKNFFLNFFRDFFKKRKITKEDEKSEFLAHLVHIILHLRVRYHAKRLIEVQKWTNFHEMFLSDFSHALEDIGTNYMSNDSSDVLVLRGEQFFQKIFKPTHFMICIYFSYGVGFCSFF